MSGIYNGLQGMQLGVSVSSQVHFAHSLAVRCVPFAHKHESEVHSIWDANSGLQYSIARTLREKSNRYARSSIEFVDELETCTRCVDYVQTFLAIIHAVPGANAAAIPTSLAPRTSCCSPGRKASFTGYLASKRILLPSTINATS